MGLALSTKGAAQGAGYAGLRCELLDCATTLDCTHDYGLLDCTAMLECVGASCAGLLGAGLRCGLLDCMTALNCGLLVTGLHARLWAAGLYGCAGLRRGWLC
ncbi:hypothetical protein Acr_18g0005950 [Actinidia rufa]|uniref:Uncharacterized protein n=1 Tax=Actinidia rufa TaxID=165716 RepID=A0A7J0G6K7_9ERIC|nr:hypothetical protein Acr_18g0005950 [Actinidia rufa]